ncbi:hypothetical protein [Sphingopyxis sp. PET50]|uniref:hypothetical protein n=1 Tax=Sphingopyxis sp. PET50 TaxID=2976533 RepID=UPI0021B03800|nr:hypothetical protein [Sphingopyxis sp. PET50]
MCLCAFVRDILLFFTLAVVRGGGESEEGAAGGFAGLAQGGAGLGDGGLEGFLLLGFEGAFVILVAEPAFLDADEAGMGGGKLVRSSPVS